MENEALTEQEFYILEVERDSDGEIISHKFVKVEGEIVDIGFDCECFASNANPPGETPAFWRQENWKVFHLQTGALMSEAFKSKELAIEDAHRRVRDAVGYNDSVKWFLKTYGRSPAAGG